MGSEVDALEWEPFEFEFDSDESEGPFEEIEEMDLASELLTV